MYAKSLMTISLTIIFYTIEIAGHSLVVDHGLHGGDRILSKEEHFTIFLLLDSNILGAVCVITLNDSLTPLACYDFILGSGQQLPAVKSTETAASC